MDYIQDLIVNIESMFENYPLVEKLLTSVVLLLITLTVISITNRLLFKTIKDNTTYYVTRKRFYYLYIFIFLLLLAVQWSSTNVDLTLYVGFISAGIAISLREIFTNMAAWIIIVTKKPFEVGDRITINGRSGDVIDIKLFHFVVMDVLDKDLGGQSTGRISHIPNNYIFLHQLTNSDKGIGFVWQEIEVRLTGDSNWQKAKEVIYGIINNQEFHLFDEVQDELRKASKRYMLYYNNVTPIIYVSFKGGNVVLVLRYLTKPRQWRMTEDLIWSEMLEAFGQMEDVTLV